MIPRGSQSDLVSMSRCPSGTALAVGQHAVDAALGMRVAGGAQSAQSDDSSSSMSSNGSARTISAP